MDYRIEKINPENEEDLKKIHQIGVYAFHPSPSDEELQSRLDKADYRSESAQYLLYNTENRAVAAATIHPLTQHLRSTIVNVGGVATVGTLPQARRKGYVSALMHHLFAEMQEADQVLSVLHPFRESFYDRYGYATLPDRHQLNINPISIKAIFKYDLPPTSFSYGEARDALEVIEQYLKKVQAQQPGMVRFTSKKFRELETSNYWYVFTQDNKGQNTGLMIYRISEYAGTMVIAHFSYLTSDAKFGLLQFCGNHIDHVEHIKLTLPRSAAIERWLMDLNFTIKNKPGAMVRIVDIHGVEDLQVSVGHEKVVVEIRDEVCPWNAGVFVIDGTSGTLTISEIEDELDNQLPKSWMSIKALSALLWGYYDIDELEIKNFAKLNSQDRAKLEIIFDYRPHEVLTYY